MNLSLIISQNSEAYKQSLSNLLVPRNLFSPSLPYQLRLLTSAEEKEGCRSGYNNNGFGGFSLEVLDIKKLKNIMM